MYNYTPVVDPLRPTLTRIPVAIALTLMLVAAWLLTHRYQGLAQDARIYAFQALAKTDHSLETDLYLQNTSQDRYTLFSPFYAQVIGLLGLQEAARVLSLLFATGFLFAAWDLAKNLLGRDEAWPAVGALILIVGAYGSYGVFHYFEDYLTARSAAEALIVAALAVHTRGFHRTALPLALFAMLVHPLMALPGVLLLIFLMVTARVAAWLAIAGIALASAIALTASIPQFRSIFPTLDAAWLPIVRERSQFLFLQLWSLQDWEVNLRPFACLALSAMVFSDQKIRKLCFAATLVGASGLLVALVAGTVGPVALLVQGQAWRWIWITVFISVILLIPTAIRLWQTEKSGPLCSLLLIASWTASVSNAQALALALVALALFAFRARIPNAAGKYLKLTAPLLGIALLSWELSHVVTAALPVSSGSADAIRNVGASAETGTAFLQKARTIAALRFPVAVMLLLIWQIVRTSRTPGLAIGMSVALGTACILLVPIAYAKTDTVGSPHEVSEFTDWRRAIPPSSNVYVANGYDAASFAWFTLQRPNYLSLDQSAGVVFSRATALEVQRRAQVLLPLMDEDWKLLSRNSAAHSAGTTPTPRRTPLTANSLATMCRDPQLNFLIAREDVGFEPLRHQHPGPWLNWNLYDCEHVRSLSPAAY